VVETGNLKGAAWGEAKREAEQGFLISLALNLFVITLKGFVPQLGLILFSRNSLP